MRAIRAVIPIVLAAMLLCLSAIAWSPAVRADSDRDTAVLNRALDLFHQGDTAGALALAEGVLTHAPDSEDGLFRSAMFNLQLNNLEAARGRLERLVKLSGNYFAAWEMMVQVAQEQGDLPRRDEAIERLKISIRTALDPEIRQKSDFTRDRIRIKGDDILCVDYFERGGSDFTRYQWSFGDPRDNPDTGLLLRTDAYTTETWAETALMPRDEQLFHLDMVDIKPEGGERVAVYAYYVGQPNFDVVRAKVMQILRGEVQPLAGQPGGLQGIMKK
jgi:tetratricopeptide (TPR) repeat protein